MFTALKRFFGFGPKPENDGKQPFKSFRGDGSGFLPYRKIVKKHPTRAKALRMRRREASRIRAINRQK